MPKYTVIIGGKERTIDKDKFDGNVDAISAKYPDARIKAINGNTEGMLPVSNYSKAIKQGYKMVEMNDVEPTPAVDPLHVQTIDSVRDYKPVIEVGANKPFDIVKEMNEPTDTQKREEERKRIEEQARKAKKASDTMHLNASADKVKADYDALSNPFTAMAAALNPVMGSGIRTVTDAQVKAEKNKDLARISGEKADDTINMIEEAKKKGDTSFVSGFGRGFWEKVSKASTWDFGARDLQSNLALAAAVDKQSKGLALSAEEDALLDAVALEAAAQGEFSGDLGRGYKAGSTSAESLPFMAEFMINPATGTGAAVGKAATKQIISKFGKEAAKSTIGKIARVSARAAGDVAGAAAMAGTTGVVRTSSDAVDRMSGEVKSTIDSDGYYRFDGMEGGDVSFKAFAKAYGASTIENFSEMFGNYLMPVGSALGGASSTIMNKIGLGKVNDIIGRVKSSDAAKIVNDFQKRTQWNGTIGEYLEEQAGMAMNALTVGDNKLSDLVDVDTQIDTFLGVSAFGGFFSGIKTAGYAKQKYKEKKKLNEAGMEASNAIGDGWEPLKDRIDEADDAELHSILSETMSDREISDEQKQSVLLYAGRLKAYHGANLADLKRKTEGDTPNEIVQAQVNFDAGYKLAEADRREKRLAAKELEAIESKLDDEFISADENTRYELMRQRSEAGEDVANELSFINAQSRFDGMIHGIRDAIDEKVASSNQYIQRSTHSDGNVYDVTLTTDDKKHVYPISGSIVIGESGIIDRRQSDKRFITRDENGNIEMRPVEDLYKVESFENSDVMKEITAQSIREQESARYAEEIETPNEEEKVQEVESLQAGSEVDLNINGVVHSAVVQSIYSDGNIEIRFDEKIVGHDGKEKNVDVFSADEVLSFIIPRESAPIDTEELKNGTENIIEGEEIAGDIKNEEEKENISSEILPSEDSITSIIEQPIETPSSESSDANTLIDPVSIEQAASTIGIPVDDKGNELYHKVPVETTLENVRSYGLDESEMDEFVAAQKVESTKRLEKLQKGKPKVGTNLSKYQSEKKAWENSVLDVKSQVDYWNEIDAQIQATRVQPGDVTAEAIASMGDPMNAEEFTAAMLGSGKLPLLFGDYKRETGFSNQDAKGMFGLFSSKSNGGMSIEEAGERLMEIDASNGTNFFDQSDANAGRNTIIDILSSSRTRGDLFGYIKGSRERMAEQERQAEYDAYEMWVNNVAHMSIADYEADMETTDNRLKEYFESFNFDEINGDIADDLIKEENDRGTKESGDESISGGNTTDIQGEPNQSSGSGSVEQPEGSGAIEESERGRQGVAEEVDVSGVDVVGSESIDGLEELTSTQIAVPSAKDGENPFDYAMRVVGAKKLHDEQRKVDVNPTEAQKEAGNYRMGHVKIGGHDVTIENPKGSVRRGVDKDGKEWEISMNNTYGYFRGTKGKDGDHIDTFLGDNLEPKSVYVVDQVNEDGTFDEHKVMYGFDTEEDAKAAYMSNYEEGWKGFGNITGVPREVFDEWLKTGTMKRKPFAEYNAVQEEIVGKEDTYLRDVSVIVEYNQDGELNEDTVDVHAFSKAIKEAKQKAIATGANKIEYVAIGGKEVTERYIPNTTKDIWLKAQNPFVWEKDVKSDLDNEKSRRVERGNLFDDAEHVVDQDKVNRNYGNALDAVNEFSEKCAGSCKTLVVKSKGLLRKQMEAIHIESEDIDKYERWFDEKETIAFHAPRYDRIIILDTSSSKDELKAYLWHENVHAALSNMDNRDEVINNIVPLVEKYANYIIERVDNGYSNEPNYKKREEYVTHFFEELIESGREHLMLSGDVKLKDVDANNAIKEILNYINNGREKDNARPRGDIPRRGARGDDGSKVEFYGKVRHSKGDVRFGAEGGRVWNDLRSVFEAGEESLRRKGESESSSSRIDSQSSEESEGIAKQEYEDSLDKTKNRMYRWQEAYQDSMLGLKKMQDAIEKESGDKLKYFEDAYMAENQMSSKSAHETEIYKDKFLIPMMDSVKSLIKNGAKQDEVKMYVMAKHGLERNREFAWRDALRSVENDEGKDFANGIQLEHDSIVSDLKSKLRSGKIDLATYDHEVFNTRSSLAPSYIANRASDYSGLVQLTGEEVNFEIVAKEMVDGFESMHSDLCDVLWEKINAATKQTLKKSYQSGLMTKRIYDKIKGMFDFYVPLRGWNDDVASDVYEYVLSERSVFNAPVKAAFGRKSMADDPFAVIGNMAESGILQGNRNLMKQKFLNMVLNHPTSLATVKTMWYENVGTVDDPVWEQSLPTIEAEATADEIAQAIDNHEARMVELSKSGMATKSTNGISLNYRASKREKSEHSVVVKSGGKEYVIFVNGNPRAAQAVNGLTNPDATDHKFMQMIGKVNRQLAANFTTRNPAFVLSNMSRDVIFSTSAIWVKEDWKYAKRFDKNIAKNIGAVVGLMARYKSGRLDMRNARDRYFLEFLENGGETGYTAIHNVEEYKKMMDRHVKKSNGTMGSLSSGVHAIVDAVSFMNRCAENVSRFTTYQTSREMGRGIVDSIRDAKEVTVNFNKKGAGGLGAGTIKSLFLFFNAAVQSLNNFKGLHDRSREKFYTTLGGFSAAGILLPMINNFIIESLIGDGDDDMTDEERAEWKKKRDSYDNLPEWVRKNNFCLWVGGEHFITIPLPIELRAFYGLGEMWYQMGRGNMNGVDGKLDTKKASIEMVNQLTELLPINPLGGNGDAISVLVPDAGKPFYQIFTNRDFFGKPIYKKNDYNELMPAWTKAFSGTAKWMVNSAELLNEVSGGDKYMTGTVDLNPAVVEHVFEGYFGGMGKTANQLFKTLSMIWDEDERMWRNVPVANRFFTGSDNKISFRKVNDAYYQYLNEYKETEQRLKGYENEAEMDIEKYAEKYDFLNGSKQHERYLIMKEYKAGIDAMRNAIKESDPEEKKEIEMEINLLKMEMIEELGKIE